MQSISRLNCHCQCWCLHAAVSQGGVGLAASWCLQHVLASFAQSHTLVAQSMLHACFAAPMCTWMRFLDGESPVGSPSLHQPGSCAGRSPALEGSSQTAVPAWTSRQGELCSPWPAPGAWLLPACVRRAPRPGCSLQAAAASPCQGLRDVCPAPSVCSTRGLGCHQPPVPRVSHCNNIKICWMRQQHAVVMLGDRFSY